MIKKLLLIILLLTPHENQVFCVNYIDNMLPNPEKEFQLEKIQHKKGDTFYVSCIYAPDGETPESIENINIYSQIRLHSGKVIDTLKIKKIEEEIGEFEILAKTEDWPIEPLLWDIKYVKNDIIVSTETYLIEMEPLTTEVPDIVSSVVTLNINSRKLILDDYFERGEFNNTEIVNDKLQLQKNMTTGSWTSPIFDTQHEHTIWEWISANADHADQLNNLLEELNPIIPNPSDTTRAQGITYERSGPNRIEDVGNGEYAIVLSTPPNELKVRSFSVRTTSHYACQDKPLHILFDLKKISQGWPIQFWLTLTEPEETPYFFDDPKTDELLSESVNGRQIRNGAIANIIHEIPDFEEQYFVVKPEQFSIEAFDNTAEYGNGVRRAIFGKVRLWLFSYRWLSHDISGYQEKVLWKNIRVYQDAPIYYVTRSGTLCEDCSGEGCQNCENGIVWSTWSNNIERIGNSVQKYFNDKRFFLANKSDPGLPISRFAQFKINIKTTTPEEKSNIPNINNITIDYGVGFEFKTPYTLTDEINRIPVFYDHNLPENYDEIITIGKPSVNREDGNIYFEDNSKGKFFGIQLDDYLHSNTWNNFFNKFPTYTKEYEDINSIGNENILGLFNLIMRRFKSMGINLIKNTAHTSSWINNKIDFHRSIGDNGLYAFYQIGGKVHSMPIVTSAGETQIPGDNYIDYKLFGDNPPEIDYTNISSQITIYNSAVNVTTREEPSTILFKNDPSILFAQLMNEVSPCGQWMYTTGNNFIRTIGLSGTSVSTFLQFHENLTYLFRRFIKEKYPTWMQLEEAWTEEYPIDRHSLSSENPQRWYFGFYEYVDEDVEYTFVDHWPKRERPINLENDSEVTPNYITTYLWNGEENSIGYDDAVFPYTDININLMWYAHRTDIIYQEDTSFVTKNTNPSSGSNGVSSGTYGQYYDYQIVTPQRLKDTMEFWEWIMSKFLEASHMNLRGQEIEDTYHGENINPLIISNNHNYGTFDLKSRALPNAMARSIPDGHDYSETGYWNYPGEIMAQHAYFDERTYIDGIGSGIVYNRYFAPRSGQTQYLNTTLRDQIGAPTGYVRGMAVPQSKSPANNSIEYTVQNIIKGMPITIPEYNSIWTTFYISDLLLFVAAYGSYHDMDAFVLFHPFQAGEIQNQIPHGYSNWYSAITPLFPAASRIFRYNYVTPGEKIIDLKLTENETYDFFGFGGSASRVNAHYPRNLAMKYRTRIESFNAISPTTINQYLEEINEEHDFSSYIFETPNKELYMNSQQGYYLVNAEKAQGFSGFNKNINKGLNSGELKYMSLNIPEKGNNYSTIVAATLDNENIIDSTHILLTAVGRHQGSNSKYNADRLSDFRQESRHRYSIKNWGEYPLIIEGITANVTLTTQIIYPNVTVNILNSEGLRTGQTINVSINDNQYSFDILDTHETCWYEILVNNIPGAPTIPEME